MNLIFIVGQTAVGKTERALNWAVQEKRAGILNADSIQIYKELNKGSAKPDFSKYPQIPFYLFNELQAPEVCTAGLFRKKALKILNEKLPEEKIFVVGGSGFYIQALEKGMYPVSQEIYLNLEEKLNEEQNQSAGSIQKKNLEEKLGLNPKQIEEAGLREKVNLSGQKAGRGIELNQKIESSESLKHTSAKQNSDEQMAAETLNLSQFYEELKSKGPETGFTKLPRLSLLYEELKSKDPETAQNISPKDRYRIVRALSLIDKEKKTLSQIKKEFQQEKLKWPYIKAGFFLPKEELLQRVAARTEQMLQQGWIEEVEDLLNKGLKNWRALNSIGYKEIQLYLTGQIKKEDLAPSIISATMKLAKKQKTWFKKDKSIQWFDANLPPRKVYQQLFEC